MRFNSQRTPREAWSCDRWCRSPAPETAAGVPRKALLRRAASFSPCPSRWAAGQWENAVRQGRACLRGWCLWGGDAGSHRLGRCALAACLCAFALPCVGGALKLHGCMCPPSHCCVCLRSLNPQTNPAPLPAEAREPKSQRALLKKQSIDFAHGCEHIRCSIVVSISARHAEDPGSIPGGGVIPQEVRRVGAVIRELVAMGDRGRGEGGGEEEKS